MSDMKIYYQASQKFVELGYHFCDTFLIKGRGEDIYKGNVSSIHNPSLQYIIISDGKISNTIPAEWDFDGYSIYGDISADNIGMKDKEKSESSLLTDKKICILDSGGMIHCLYNDLHTVEFCIENFYADSVFQKMEYMHAKAFTYGYRMRMGLLGDIVFFNVLVQNGFRLFARDIPKERIEISNDNIICMRIIANFVKRYFDNRGINFEKCNTDIAGSYRNLLKEDFPPFLKLQMIRYLSQYSMTLALASDDFPNLFVALQIVFTYAIETKNLILAQWTFENLLDSPYADEGVVSILNKKMSRFEHIMELKYDINNEWYSLFWQNFELCMNSVDYKKYEERDKELLITTAIICETDKIACEEIQEMFNEAKNDDTIEFLRRFLMD